MMKRFISHLWELPQDLLGYVISRKCKLRHTVNGRGFYEWNAYEGMSLGHYIFVHPKYMSTKLIRHEYGHSIQSSILGWFYLPLVGLTSWCWYHVFDKYVKSHPTVSYYDFFVESWANKLGKVKKDEVNDM